MPEIVSSWQMPFWFAPVFVHLPVQHSAFEKQVSLICPQYEAVAAHVPPTHACEQHSAFAPHGLPEPRQVVVSRRHVPLVQRPLQHWVLDVHALAVGKSGRHAVTWQVLFDPQLPEQQSDPVMQARPVV
jgi:hypothetical protein